MIEKVQLGSVLAIRIEYTIYRIFLVHLNETRHTAELAHAIDRKTRKADEKLNCLITTKFGLTLRLIPSV